MVVRAVNFHGSSKLPSFAKISNVFAFKTFHNFFALVLCHFVCLMYLFDSETDHRFGEVFI